MLLSDLYTDSHIRVPFDIRVAKWRIKYLTLLARPVEVYYFDPLVNLMMTSRSSRLAWNILAISSCAKNL